MKPNLKQYSLSELEQIRDSFAEELTQAASGQKTSFVFAKNPLPGKKIHADTERQVLVIGGTFCETARMKGDSMRQYRKIQLPRIATVEIFMSFLEEVILPDTKIVLMNLAYPLNPVLRNNLYLDATLITGTKEHLFEGLTGKLVGATIIDYFSKKRKQELIVAVANDTVCLALSGAGKYDVNRIIAGIVGTGVNFGFFAESSIFINLEAGVFDKFSQTSTGRDIDASSSQPGQKQFEKEVSGAYLYLHYNILAKEAGFVELQSSEDLSKVAQSTGSPAELAQAILERSAQLVASALAGLYLHKNSVALDCIIEGSLFWKGYRYRETVEEYLAKLGVPLGHIRFHKVDNSAIIGASYLFGV